MRRMPEGIFKNGKQIISGDAQMFRYIGNPYVVVIVVLYEFDRFDQIIIVSDVIGLCHMHFMRAGRTDLFEKIKKQGLSCELLLHPAGIGVQNLPQNLFHTIVVR